MFTGIVQGTAQITKLERKADFMQLTIELPESHADHLAIGASIALNGTCLTVTGFSGSQVSFDLIMETLRVTNLGDLQVGDTVNFERAARFGDEIGGHLLSGHISEVAQVTAVERPDNNCVVWFEAPESLIKYILPKGYVALNGCSLTIGEVRGRQFNVFLIPETLALTVFKEVAPGMRVNLEVDPQTQAVVDTTERVLATRG